MGINLLLKEMNELRNERDALKNERDALKNERDAPKDEKDALKNERNEPSFKETLEDPKSVLEKHPFHLSLCCRTLEEAREFYTGLLGCAEKRATKTSVHIDFFGNQLTLHALGEDYSATSIHREVDAEDVPVPHFGGVFSIANFHKIAEKLKAVDYPCVLEPHVRFLDKPHEQWIVFILDPAGNAIEIKAFTKIPEGTWV